MTQITSGSGTALSRIPFQGKGRTLAALEPVLVAARVLPQVSFSVEEWKAGPAAVIFRILGAPWGAGTLIVRSSAHGEDAPGRSQAGRFRSVGGVRGRTALEAAIGEVAASMGEGGAAGDVFVQPCLEDVTVSGVVFSRDPSTGGHYLVLNFDDVSGRTDTVTSGTSAATRTVIADKGQPIGTIEGWMGAVQALVRELEERTGSDRLDIEFAVGSDEVVTLLQVRPLHLTVENPRGPDEQRKILEIISRRIAELDRPHPYLHGSRTAFGVMPDWNPAEIIGIRPRPLALSLYKELVTDNIWAYQRDNYGYKNLRSFPLLLSFAGLPYIDVRVSFNSFLPADIGDDLAERLANYYLDRLLRTPSHHDKVEFEILYSCYTLDLRERMVPLAKAGFCTADQDALARGLRDLTNRIIHEENGLWRKDIAKIDELERRQAKIMGADLDLVSKAYWLLEDCKRYGTLPFAGLARAGFIAVQFLRSLVTTGVLSPRESDDFMASLRTVGSRMGEDLARLAPPAFLEIYGHLRPGTYDILSPRYDQTPGRYFGSFERKPPVPARPGFSLGLEPLNKLQRLLREHEIHHDVLSLFNFLKAAIEGREYSKFVFTRSLSDALVLLGRLGEEVGIGLDDMSYVHIDAIRALHTGAEDVRGTLLDSVEKGRKSYEITRHLTLPPLISSAADVFAFRVPENEPSFVTMGAVEGPVVRVDSPPERLAGAILMIPSADPGFDWIFTKGIGGFITMYGGVNSHMAIRAGELGIPAVIGAGELLYGTWAAAEVLRISCDDRRVTVIR